MDKWEELTDRIQKALLAEEPEAAVSAGFQLVVEFGRTFEQMSADSDRIATALEKLAEITNEHEPAAIPIIDESEPQHDL